MPNGSNQYSEFRHVFTEFLTTEKDFTKQMEGVLVGLLTLAVADKTFADDEEFIKGITNYAKLLQNPFIDPEFQLAWAAFSSEQTEENFTRLIDALRSLLINESFARRTAYIIKCSEKFNNLNVTIQAFVKKILEHQGQSKKVLHSIKKFFNVSDPAIDETTSFNEMLEITKKLNDFILAPTQRLVRIKLLVNSLLKSAPPDAKARLEPIAKAFDILCTYANEKVPSIAIANPVMQQSVLDPKDVATDVKAIFSALEPEIDEDKNSLLTSIMDADPIDGEESDNRNLETIYEEILNKHSDLKQSAMDLRESLAEPAPTMQGAHQTATRIKLDNEVEKLQKELNDLKKELEGVSHKLSTEIASAEVLDKTIAKLIAQQEELQQENKKLAEESPALLEDLNSTEKFNTFAPIISEPPVFAESIVQNCKKLVDISTEITVQALGTASDPIGTIDGYERIKPQLAETSAALMGLKAENEKRNKIIDQLNQQIGTLIDLNKTYKSQIQVAVKKREEVKIEAVPPSAPEPVHYLFDDNEIENANANANANQATAFDGRVSSVGPQALDVEENSSLESAGPGVSEEQKIKDFIKNRINTINTKPKSWFWDEEKRSAHSVKGQQHMLTTTLKNTYAKLKTVSLTTIADEFDKSLRHSPFFRTKFFRTTMATTLYKDFSMPAESYYSHETLTKIQSLIAQVADWEIQPTCGFNPGSKRKLSTGEEVLLPNTVTKIFDLCEKGLKAKGGVTLQQAMVEVQSILNKAYVPCAKGASSSTNDFYADALDLIQSEYCANIVAYEHADFAESLKDENFTNLLSLVKSYEDIKWQDTRWQGEEGGDIKEKIEKDISNMQNLFEENKLQNVAEKLKALNHLSNCLFEHAREIPYRYRNGSDLYKSVMLTIGKYQHFKVEGLDKKQRSAVISQVENFMDKHYDYFATQTDKFEAEHPTQAPALGR